MLYCIKGKVSIFIGRHHDNDIVVNDPYISRKHVEIYTGSDEYKYLADIKVKGRNGIKINNITFNHEDSASVCRSDIITVGNIVVMWLGDYLFVDVLDEGCSEQIDICTIVTSGLKRIDLFEINEKEYGGTVRFTGTVRKEGRYDETPIEIEAPPTRRQPEKPSIFLAAGPVLTMALPMILGFGRKISALTSVMAAFWAGRNVVVRQKKIKNEERRRRNSYISYISECEQNIISRCSEIKKVWESAFPEAQEYFRDGGNPYVLWNRVDEDDFYGLYRLGTGNQKIPIDINIPKNRFAQLDDSLRELPLQLKEKYSTLENVPVFVDLLEYNRVAVIGDNKYLISKLISTMVIQIMTNGSPDNTQVSISIGDEELYNRLKWIENTPHFVKGEGNPKKPYGNGKTVEKYRRIYVFITDKYQAEIENMDLGNGDLVFLQVLRSNEKTPANTRCIISDSSFTLVTNNKRTISSKVKFDYLEYDLCKEYARRMVKLWGLRQDRCESIPEKVSFGDLFGDNLDVTIVKNKWIEADVKKEISFPIGIDQFGKVVCLDIHERKHGPHGIIAGTTGSGKSELLTTVILSAALCYPPDKMGFFLVDYKGGGMANLFSKLPHLLGSISNLSREESVRAMKSLRNENIRRQEIFNKYGINNISDYIQKYTDGSVIEPLPHILIVIDEFAELKKEQPDFMQELVSIAAVGRSLGIHLLLATQKPAGVVDDKIRSNSRFRICLRVESSSDSLDVLRKPDAAYVAECGRAYIQVGNDELYTLFQTGYAMSIFDSDVKTRIRFEDDECAFDSGSDENTTNQSWYERCMQIIERADCELATRHASIVCLPKLKSKINVDASRIKDNNFIIGVADNPEKQRYEAIIYSITNPLSTCILGPPMSGKSYMISEMLYGISVGSDDAFNVYIVDYGGGRLREFEDSPICGGYIGVESPMRIPMLLTYIRDIVHDRRKIYSQQTGQKRTGLPNILLIIDNLGEVVRSVGEQYISILSDVIRYGSFVNVSLIVTGLEAGGNDIPIKIVNSIEQVILLGRQDKYKVASILNASAKEVPDIMDTPGRGVINIDDKILEVQIVTYTRINQWNKKGGGKAEQYPYIPDNPSVDIFLDRIIKQEARIHINDFISNLPVGYEEKTGRIYYLPLDRVNCVLVSGRSGTGKKTFINVISIIMARIKAEPIYVTNGETLINILYSIDKSDNSNHRNQVILIKNLDTILCDIRENSHTNNQELNKFFDNSILNNKVTIIGVLSETGSRYVQNQSIDEAIMKKPYVVYFGGGLDEQRMFDYSYLPYSIQTQKKSPGSANVIKFNKKLFYGDVVIPNMPGNESDF